MKMKPHVVSITSLKNPSQLFSPRTHASWGGDGSFEQTVLYSAIALAACCRYSVGHSLVGSSSPHRLPCHRGAAGFPDGTQKWAGRHQSVQLPRLTVPSPGSFPAQLRHALWTPPRESILVMVAFFHFNPSVGGFCRKIDSPLKASVRRGGRL